MYVLEYCDVFFFHSSSVFFGPAQMYLISDVDLVKEITVKHFDKFTDRSVSTITWTLTSPARL